MRKMWKNRLAITVISVTVSLSLLLMSGTALGGGGSSDPCKDNGDGTMTDVSANLMWQIATSNQMTWSSAQSHASTLSLGGKSGWRLPTIAELTGLYSSTCNSYVVMYNALYWSSTVSSSDSQLAKSLNFLNNEQKDVNKTESHYVRPVRNN